MVDFVFALIELFSLSITSIRVPEFWRNVYSSAVFTGGRSLCTQVLPEQGVPISHSWYQKTRDTGLPDGEYRIPLRSLILTQYRSVTDGLTDGWTNLP